MDFGGRVLLHRHRTHPGDRFYNVKPRCLTPDEMIERGWYMDRFGRWRDARGRKREEG